MTEYEKQRSMRMQQNKAKMEELGIKTLAYEAMCLKEQKRQKVTEAKSKRVYANNNECIHDEDCELDHASEVNYKESMQTRRSLRLPLNKEMASTGKNPVKSITASRGGNHVKVTINQHSSTNSTVMGDRGRNIIKSNTLVKKGKSKTSLAPGSLGAYVRMRVQSKENEQVSKTIGQLTESSSKRQAIYTQMQQFGLAEEDEGSESDDCVFEERNDVAPEQLENEMAEIRNESIATQDQQTDQLDNVCTAQPTKKRTRGPSMCKDVHGWTINDRKAIILNEKGEPIGPDKKSLGTFSRFLGTLARDSTLAPLNKLNWHRVSGKDNIWDYVKMKYMIADEGKDYVLKTVGRLWSGQKSRIKKKHYKPYTNVDDRWKNKPPSIPDSHFKELIEYWDLDEVQELSEKNKERTEAQIDRHTMGPVSFARKKYELQLAHKKAPSQAELYRETRKRVEVVGAELS